MTKEIYISSTPHETRLALVEDDRLAEIYYERENEYTLAGSIYKGRVTRVLPGMQSAFVDVGLERDAFLYVTDFVEENEEGEEYVPLPQGQVQQEEGRNAPRNGPRNERPNEGRNETRSQAQPLAPGPAAVEDGADNSQEQDQGTRRWRGRRGRRRSNDRSNDRGNDRTVAPASVPEKINLTGAEAISGPGPEVRASEHASYERPALERQRSGGRREQREAPYDTSNLPSNPSSSASPLVLPGESLSKYRHDAGTASTGSASVASTPTAPIRTPSTPIPTFRPSTMVDAPLDWDGGQTLPGESLSRYRNVSPARAANAPASTSVAETFPPATETVAGPAEVAFPGPAGPGPTEPGPVEVADVVPCGAAEVAVPAETLATGPTAEAVAGPVAAPVAAAETVPASAPANTAPLVAEAEDVPVSAAPTETAETEAIEDGPDGASASYRASPTKPSAFRLGRARTPETVAAPVTEQTPGSDAHDAPAPVPSAPEDTQPAMPVAVQVPAEVETVKGSEDNEEGLSGEDVGEDTDEDVNDATLHAFAPGTGLLEEELIDEEEAEAPASRALLDENELDELVEETLDVQMDGGLLSDMVRDAHIEERIRYNEDQNGQVVEEEETDEDDDEFAPEASLDSDDGAIAEETPEGAGQEGTAQPAQPRTGFRGRGRQSSRRRPGGYAGHGRRATAQTTNMPAITELLKAGQEILVQIAKEPMARKGARITSHIALPGRFLVFMPTVDHVGVSRKIASDEERQRLKHILISEKGNVGGGFIVRTAAATASEEDLRADIRFLLNLWADIRQRSESSKPPALIYHDLSLVERVLRDRVSENFSTIWVDTESDYERVLRFLERFQPSLLRHVKLYTKETPLFEQFGIQEEINKALSSKVWLKSGGSIVINQTEALVAIDVNTGKYVGKTARLEDTILRTNLDAIPEIVRQVRLRDLGGIIIIDFIDMDERRNRQKVMQALEEELHTDRAPSKVLQFNDFGLVAITRKRVKQSLERTLSTPCAVCSGTGMVKSPVTVCNEIYIELRKMYRHLERGDILLRVHPEVVKQLKLNNARWISEMEELSGKTILVKSDPSLQPEQFDIQ